MKPIIKATINPAQRTATWLERLRLNPLTIVGARTVVARIHELSRAGALRIIVGDRYLAATFNNREFLALTVSAAYARALSSNGVSEISFAKETSTHEIARVLGLLATAGPKKIRKQGVGFLAPRAVSPLTRREVQQLPVDQFLRLSQGTDIRELVKQESWSRDDAALFVLLARRVFPTHLSTQQENKTRFLDLVGLLNDNQRMQLEQVLSAKSTIFNIMTYYFESHYVAYECLLSLSEAGRHVGLIMASLIENWQRFSFQNKELILKNLFEVRGVEFHREFLPLIDLFFRSGSGPYRGASLREWVDSVLTLMVEKGRVREADDILERLEEHNFNREDIRGFVQKMIDFGVIRGVNKAWDCFDKYNFDLKNIHLALNTLVTVQKGWQSVGTLEPNKVEAFAQKRALSEEIRGRLLYILVRNQLIREPAFVLKCLVNPHFTVEEVARFINYFLPKSGKNTWEETETVTDWGPSGTHDRDQCIYDQEFTYDVTKSFKEEFYTEDDFQRAGTIINAHRLEKRSQILDQLNDDLQKNVRKYVNF